MKIKKFKKNKAKNSGFAAFTLVIFISTLMLTFTFMQGIEYSHFFDQTKTKEYRLMSYYSAYSCIDQALLGLTHDYFFLVQSEIEFPDLFCSIDSISDSSGLKTITVHGKYKNIFVYRLATARLYDDHLEIISIE